MKIALYSSTPRQGKDTAADYLVKNYNFKKVVLAKPFRSMLAALLKYYNYDNSQIFEYLEGSRKEEIIPELDVTPRYLQRTIGNEWGVHLINKQIWCKTIPYQAQGAVNVVISDLRQVHEYEFLDDYFKIKIIRNTGREKEHVSDMQLEDYEFDYVIENNGTLEELYTQVEKVITILSIFKAASW